MQKFKLYIFLFIMMPGAVVAQLREYPLERNNKLSNRATAKTQALVSLPFWDDFSLTSEHPDDELWSKNSQVLVNNGQARNPPTLYVATFDGLNENGTPYSPNPSDVLDYGYRDTLESQLIKMTEVVLAQRNTVFLSFFYQAGGAIEPPNENDFLRLEFKSQTGQWKPIDTLRMEDDTDPTAFYQVMIRINQDEYFHDDFQFRFISFGRKSGRFDGWHIDYVYLDKGRSDTDDNYPDRSFYTGLSGIFNQYHAVPVKHFLANRTVTKPFIGVSNMEGVPQPGNFDYIITTRSFNNTALLNQQVFIHEDTIDPSLQALEQRMLQLGNNPPPTAFHANADSITLRYALDYDGSGDIVDPAFSNIDFRVNDTVTFNYTLSDYYAYDDGTAEYTAGLNQSGNQMAYRFVADPGQDSILNGVDIYFAAFNGAITSTVEVFVLDTLINNQPLDPLHEETIDTPPQGESGFVSVDFYSGIIVRDTFYIGYREPNTGSIRIGLDKNNDSGNHMFYRLTQSGAWQLNDRVFGSMMIRPRFGPADIIVGLPEETPRVSVYPNPSKGSFYMKGKVDQLQITTITGEPVFYSAEDFGEEKRIELSNPQIGFYILRYRSGRKVYTHKVVVRQ